MWIYIHKMFWRKYSIEISRDLSLDWLKGWLWANGSLHRALLCLMEHFDNFVITKSPIGGTDSWSTDSWSLLTRRQQPSHRERSPVALLAGPMRKHFSSTAAYLLTMHHSSAQLSSAIVVFQNLCSHVWGLCNLDVQVMAFHTYYYKLAPSIPSDKASLSVKMKHNMPNRLGASERIRRLLFHFRYASSIPAQRTSTNFPLHAPAFAPPLSVPAWIPRNLSHRRRHCLAISDAAC